MNRKRRNSRRTPRTLTFRGELGADWDDDWDVLDSVSSIIAESDERRPVVDVVAPIRHMVGSAWRVHVQAWGADRERIRRGQQYLADGAVDELLVERGRIKAIVKGTRKYTVQIVVGMPTATAAEPLLERLRGTSGERTIAALADALRAEGDTLLHDTVRRMVVVCTCPDGSGCKHSVAVVHGFAAYLDRDPRAAADAVGPRRRDRHEQRIHGRAARRGPRAADRRPHGAVRHRPDHADPGAPPRSRARPRAGARVDAGRTVTAAVAAHGGRARLPARARDPHAHPRRVAARGPAAPARPPGRVRPDRRAQPPHRRVPRALTCARRRRRDGLTPAAHCGSEQMSCGRTQSNMFTQNASTST